MERKSQRQRLREKRRERKREQGREWKIKVRWGRERERERERETTKVHGKSRVKNSLLLLFPVMKLVFARNESSSYHRRPLVCRSPSLDLQPRSRRHIRTHFLPVSYGPARSVIRIRPESRWFDICNWKK